MIKDEIDERIENNEIYLTPKYVEDQNYIERLSFGNKNTNNNNDSYISHYQIQNPSNIIPNPVNPRHYSSLNKKYNGNYGNNYNPYYKKNNINENCTDSFYNYNNTFNNINNYSQRTYNKNIMNNQSPFICRNDRRNYMNYSQDMSPIYLNSKKNINNNSSLFYNNSHIVNGYATEAGESCFNYNRESNINNQYPYQGFSIIYPPEEKTNNTFESNDEQLIIYPEDININKYEKEKYFDSNTSEGILKPKNLEVYKVNCVEYVHDDQRKYKPINLGDYFLRKASKNKKRKTKSCKSCCKDINEYEIKVFNKKNKRKILFHMMNII